MLLGQSEMTGGNFIATIMLVFGVTYIEDAVHPGRGIRAIKILKRQLKEGRFGVTYGSNSFNKNDYVE